MSTNPIPDGLHTLTPQLAMNDCDSAIEWFKTAFGATLHGRAPDPSGKKVWHAEMRIGDSAFFLNDVFPDMGGGPQTASLWIYAEECDALFAKAVEGGAKVVMPMMDMFWGDRIGTVTDPFGNRWSLARRIKNLTAEQMQAAQDEFVKNMKK